MISFLRIVVGVSAFVLNAFASESDSPPPVSSHESVSSLGPRTSVSSHLLPRNVEFMGKNKNGDQGLRLVNRGNRYTGILSAKTSGRSAREDLDIKRRIHRERRKYDGSAADFLRKSIANQEEDVFTLAKKGRASVSDRIFKEEIQLAGGVHSLAFQNEENEPRRQFVSPPPEHHPCHVQDLVSAGLTKVKRAPIPFIAIISALIPLCLQRNFFSTSGLDKFLGKMIEKSLGSTALLERSKMRTAGICISALMIGRMGYWGHFRTSRGKNILKSREESRNDVQESRMVAEDRARLEHHKKYWKICRALQEKNERKYRPKLCGVSEAKEEELSSDESVEILSKETPSTTSSEGGWDGSRPASPDLSSSSADSS